MKVMEGLQEGKKEKEGEVKEKLHERDGIRGAKRGEGEVISKGKSV